MKTNGDPKGRIFKNDARESSLPVSQFIFLKIRPEDHRFDHLLAHKDGAIFLDKSHLNVEASYL